MAYSCTFAARSLVAKVCRRSWKWKSPIPASLTVRSKQTINWHRFRPVRVGSKISSSSGASGTGSVSTQAPKFTWLKVGRWYKLAVG